MKKEFFGTSVEDALQRAELLYGVEARRLEYSVVEGEFARTMGARKVAILVRVPERPQKKAELETLQEPAPPREPGSLEWASYVLRGMFERMGIVAKVSCKERGDNAVLTVELPEDSLDLRRGESRELRGAIQHLVNRAASGEGEKEKRFIVDIGGTLEKRREKMVELAGQLARLASRQGRPIHVHLMDSQDRRIVHTALAEDQSVVTTAMGEAQFRVLTVEPKKAR